MKLSYQWVPLGTAAPAVWLHTVEQRYVLALSFAVASLLISLIGPGLRVFFDVVLLDLALRATGLAKEERHKRVKARLKQSQRRPPPGGAPSPPD